MRAPIGVFVIDDHDAVRRALLASLSLLPGIQVVGGVGDAEEGLLQVRALRPEVVLVETKRADGRGLEIVSWIAHDGTVGAYVIVLTSYPSEWERWAAYRAGAKSYLLKDIGSPQLIAQIRAGVKSQ